MLLREYARRFFAGRFITRECHSAIPRRRAVSGRMKTPRLLAVSIAPAVMLVNATTATFTDVDGDHVTIKVSTGTLTAHGRAFALTAGGDNFVVGPTNDLRIREVL